MMYHGIIRNGQVYVEGGVPLPEGAKVEIEVIDLRSESFATGFMSREDAGDAWKPTARLVVRVISMPDESAV